MTAPRPRWLALAIGIALVLVLVGVALARPGGGDSFSGGGGHGGGGGGGGGGDGDGILVIIELIYYLVILCIEAPYIGFPLVAIIIGFILYSAYKQHANKDWDSGPPQVQHSVKLEAVRRVDPDFSQVLFEDFVFRLFSTVHRTRSTDGLAGVAPYLTEGARETLVAMPPTGEIKQVIVGAMRPFRVEVPGNADDGIVRVHLELEANLSTDKKTYFVVETWQLTRAATVRTKPPSASRTFPCPNCGAPWQSTATTTQKCASCSEVVDNGRFDWVVQSASRTSTDERGPTLTTEVPERGTDLPTYRHQEADHRFSELAATDPELGTPQLDARIGLIHREVAQAWSKNELAPVRGLVSDGLYDYLDYWVQAYKRSGLRNVMADLRITRTELAKVVRDRWYDAVTIRIWATGKDFVVETATGKVVKGSKRRDRAYSEYWTLIRSAGRTGAPKATRSCGNCGAPLQVSMAGACEHCGAHVTAGEFDWVLSKIEQDDSYRG